jgi:hypothetical protein
MTTTPTGVEHEAGDSLDDAADAILNRWMDADKKLSDQGGGAKPPRKRAAETVADEEENEEADEELDEGSADDEDQGEAEGDDQEDENEGEADEPKEAGDDALVSVTIDGETRQIPVKDLKRLYGQEASLTRKSQEVAQAKKKAEEDGARYVTAAETLMSRAEERFKPYSTIDWAIAQKTLDNDEFVALRQEAVAAYQDLQFLQQDLNTTFEKARAEREAASKEAAQEAIRQLSDPTTGIPGWSAETYQAILTHAVTNGMDKDAVSSVTDASFIKLLNKARLYDLAAAKVKNNTKLKASSAKRTMKSKGSSNPVATAKAASDAMKKLRQTGTAEDAANAFMERWKSEGDD